MAITRTGNRPESPADDAQQVERRLVRPVHVLEHDDRRRIRAPQQTEERVGRTVLITVAELVAQVAADLIGHVDDRSERASRCDGVARAPQDGVFWLGGREGVNQRRLANASLAADEDQPSMPPPGVSQQVGQLSQEHLAFEQLHRWPS